jgi:hypothetical protein
MGIEVSYRRLSPDEFQGLLDHPERVDAFFGWDTGISEELRAFYQELEDNGRYFEVGKDWQALHYVFYLAREMDTTTMPPPLGNVIFGGTPTPWEAGYGMVRYLTPEEVQDVASALSAIEEDELRPRLDLAVFQEVDIDPRGDSWDHYFVEYCRDSIGYLLNLFARVRDFFSTAARDGDVVLLSCD